MLLNICVGVDGIADCDCDTDANVDDGYDDVEVLAVVFVTPECLDVVILFYFVFVLVFYF